MKIKTVLILTLLYGGTFPTFAQSNKEKPISKETVQLGAKGSKEITGSISASIQDYDYYNLSSIQFLIGVKYFAAKNLHLGLNPNLAFFYNANEDIYGMMLNPSISLGYLFPIKNNLYFNVEGDFKFYLSSFIKGSIAGFTPSLITSLKQALKTFVINYSIIHTFTRYENFYSFDPPAWNTYYNLDFTIGLSFYF